MTAPFSSCWRFFIELASEERVVTPLKAGRNFQHSAAFHRLIAFALAPHLDLSRQAGNAGSCLAN
jgi:hypothetical protein